MNPTSVDSLVGRLRYAACLGLIGLIAATWPLWTPHAVFPRVPLFAFGLSIPSTIEWCVLFGLAGSLGFAVFARRDRIIRLAMLVSAICLSMLFLTDQHRLQPWAYELMWVLFALSLCRPSTALFLIRLLVISIYFWSGISKLDYQFVYTTGREFIEGLADLLGLQIDDWSQPTLIAITLALPLAECLIAVALMFRKTRRVAVAVAISMHVVLIVLLSPMGLNHQPGVWLWNAFSAVFAFFLFWRHEEGQTTDTTPDPCQGRYPFQGLAMVAIISAVLLPIAEPFGRYDHWLAWGLYAPHNSRVLLFIDERAANRVPESVKPHIGPSRGDSPWQQIHLDRWSIDRLFAPIYPQQRFQAGVAYWLLIESGLESGFRAEFQSPSDRRLGDRVTNVATDLDQMRMQLSKFTCNPIPRR